MSPVDEAAIAWASRLDAGLASHEHAELAAWLARDPSHEWRLAHFCQFYAKLHGTVPGLLAEGRVTLPAVRPARPVRPARWLGGLAAAAALLFGTVFFAFRSQSVATTVAQRTTLTLADGTRADLNARTALSIQLRAAERRVQLQSGEVYFEVSKDPARPFYVETPTGTVRVTGTRFNVRATAPGSLEVTVLEGSVAVSAHPEGAPGREFQLRPHDQVTVEGGLATAQRLAAAATDNVVAWREGKVVFDDTPLAVALERFAAYHGRQLSAAPEVAGLLLGGRFSLDDCDAFLSAAEKMLPVKARRGEGGTVRFVATESVPAAR